jgi:hypothetical protein
MYISPNVTQIRNEHNLMSDFKSEYEMYIANEDILTYIEVDVDNTNHLVSIYQNLLKKQIITSLDIDILQEWLTYF